MLDASDLQLALSMGANTSGMSSPSTGIGKECSRRGNVGEATATIKRRRVVRGGCRALKRTRGDGGDVGERLCEGMDKKANDCGGLKGASHKPQAFW